MQRNFKIEIKALSIKTFSSLHLIKIENQTIKVSLRKKPNATKLKK